MKTALIVDDNAEALYLLKCILAADGFRILEARNGKEALERAAGADLDLVVSDILMPVMDGFSLCRSLKNDPRLRSVPFVFYTATYIDKRDEDFALSLGADLFLVKPAEPDVLLGRIKGLLRQPRGPDKPVPTLSEAPFLEQYNQVLIHKLEDKVAQLERANQELMIKEFALQSSTSGILITDGADRITYINPAMLRLTGRVPAAVLGHAIPPLFAVPTEVVDWLASTAGPKDFRLAATAESPTETWLRLESQLVRDHQGKVHGRMVFGSDITGERRLRQELSRIQRLEALSLFAAGVAHDFNNLLMGIFSGLELGTPIKEIGSEAEANRAMALAAFERARELTRRLLTFSKHSGGDRHPVDLRSLLDECLSLSLSGSAITCERRYPDTPAIANVDPGQIAQVFGNLIVNARQAMGDKGAMLVRIAGAPDAIVVGITDNGPGIPEDILPNIFEPYFTTKVEGTGLGLATSQAIIHEHGGRISVRSRPDAGATFEIILPGLPDETPLPVLGPAPRTRSAGMGRILVMDDQLPIQALLVRGLGKQGYTVTVASDGDEALREFRRARDDGREFDLLLFDITIRGGMGGVETIQRIHALKPNVLAIAMTGYADDEVVRDLKQNGFAQVIAKPFLLHELFATIQAVLP